MTTRAFSTPALACCLLLAGAMDLCAQVPAENFMPLPIEKEVKPGHDRLFWTLIDADAVLTSFDGWTTSKLLTYPGTKELDPLLGRHPSDQRIALTFSAAMALRFFGAREMEKHNHPRVAKSFLAASIALETYCGIHNFRMMQQRGY